jgi:hypothetical protein
MGASGEQGHQGRRGGEDLPLRISDLGLRIACPEQSRRACPGLAEGRIDDPRARNAKRGLPRRSREREGRLADAGTYGAPPTVLQPLRPLRPPRLCGQARQHVARSVGHGPTYSPAGNRLREQEMFFCETKPILAVGPGYVRPNRVKAYDDSPAVLAAMEGSKRTQFGAWFKKGG